MESIKQHGLHDRFCNHIANSLQSIPADQRRLAQLVVSGIRWIAANEADIASICILTWESSARVLVEQMDKVLNSKSDFNISSKTEPMFESMAKIAIENYLRKGVMPSNDSHFLASILTPPEQIPARVLAAKDQWLPLLQQQIIHTGMTEHLNGAASFEERLSRTMERADIQANVLIDSIDKTERALAQFQGKTLKEAFESAERKLETYQNQAKKLEGRFAFVSIAGAFRDMGDNKQKELKKATTVMVVLALIALAPLVLSLITALKATSLTHYEFTLTLDQAIPRFLVILPLEIILIYFFRIALKNQLSIQAQLLQLQLRYSVCAFIEGYAEFAKGLEKEKLEKFEALVFSGLSPNPDNVPSTFDGMDQLINLVKATKSTS